MTSPRVGMSRWLVRDGVPDQNRMFGDARLTPFRTRRAARPYPGRLCVLLVLDALRGLPRVGMSRWLVRDGVSYQNRMFGDARLTPFRTRRAARPYPGRAAFAARVAVAKQPWMR